MEEYLIGVDLGTSSTKAVLAGTDGVVHATARRPHAMSLPRPGWAEMDAQRDWWDDVAIVISQLTAEVPAEAVVGVCVSGLGPCMAIADAAGEPLRPAMLYGIDMRAGAQIAALQDRYGTDAILGRCGKSLSSQAVGPKLLWVRDELPELWAIARRWYSSHTYVVARLTGEYVLDHQTASQCDPLYDLLAGGWAQDWASELVPSLELPRLAWPSEIVGEVTPAAARRTGLAAGTPVGAGAVDAWAVAFGAGVRNNDDVMLMYGSTMFFLQVVAEVTPSPIAWTTTGVERGTFTLAAGPATSGSLVDWVRRLTGCPSFDTLLAEAQEVTPGADGLLMLPYFAGERAPLFDPDARGLVAGLNLNHTRGHLARAAYEGIAFGMRQILEGAGVIDRLPERVVAVGGGTRGRLWTQIISDVIGHDQHVPAETIGASYGSALLAAIGTGRVSPETDWARLVDRIACDPERHARYEELYGAFCDLYPATRESMHRMARIRERAVVDLSAAPGG